MHSSPEEPLYNCPWCGEPMYHVPAMDDGPDYTCENGHEYWEEGENDGSEP